MIIGLFTGFPIWFLKKVAGVNNLLLKVFFCILYLGTIGTCLYITFVNVAIVGLEVSNEWCLSYVLSFLTEGAVEYIFIALKKLFF